MGKRFLLVEGKDDEHVVKAIFGRHGLANLDEIIKHDGYDHLMRALPVRLQESDVDALGVVVDADLEVQSRWDALKHRLREAGYPDLPSSPPAEGLVLAAPPDTLLPRFGAWIMPDNVVPGILEHFLATLVPPEDALYTHVETAVDTIPQFLRRFREVDLPKAKIHTYLAWQNEPGRSLGFSITRNVLQADSPSCLQVVNWLQRLYAL